MTSSQDRRNVYRRAVRGLRPVLLAVLALSAVINLLMLTGSVYMLQVYDRVLPGGSVPTLVALFTIVVALFGFLAVFDVLRARFLSRAALRLDAGVGDRAFQGGQALGDLATVRGFAGGPAMAALFDLPFVPLFVAALFLLHPWLGIAILAGAGVGAAIALLNGWTTGRAIRATAAPEQAERIFADSSRRNAEAIVAMGMQRAVAARWRQLHNVTLSRAQAGSDPSEVFAGLSRSFRMLLQSAILTLGALLVLRGEITAGAIIAASILSGRALAPLDQMIGQWRVIARARAAHRRLGAGLTDLPARPPLDLPAPTGQITVSNLCRLRPGPDRAAGNTAATTTDPDAILSGVSFHLAAGDGLGVIGSSASGKSTLARLLVGALAPDAGSIRLDGATADQWDPAVLGRHIGYLPQVVDLLPGTIRDTIARLDPTVTDAEVLDAARLTGVHDMILALPEGYATGVGHPGGTSPLSGGQIQRIGLARAICGGPALVVLDEPNANLDAAGDAALTRTIRSLRAAGSTVIVMTHRPTALAALNKLLVLEAGRVRSFGNKDALAAQGDGYAAALLAGGPALSQQDGPPGGNSGKRPTIVPTIVSGQIPVGAPAQTPARTPVQAPSVVRNAGPRSRRTGI